MERDPTNGSFQRETPRKVSPRPRETLGTRKWWMWILFMAGAVPPRCSGLHVSARDEKKYSVLFQTVVLPCQYNSVSTQVPVVQWIYKSYCRDRTRDSFSLYDGLGGGGAGVGGHGGMGGAATGAAGGLGGAYQTGMSHLDCSDSGRTVRMVASVSGSSMTLSEFYKDRDISIINKADLRIGEVQWGDSGVYVCKVVISDDVNGQSEASVELLVLGFSGEPEDLLPDFELKMMPEWLFVGAVALGVVLFLLFLGICWCQCCPHSCCCYVSCWCCPDTCCCPRHLYEAGKGLKTGPAPPQTPPYPPYFVSGVPTMVPIAPPSLVDQLSLNPSDGSVLTAVPMRAVGVPYRVATPADQDSLRVLQYVEKQLAHFNPAQSVSRQTCSLSELSSLHEEENGFRHTYRNVQKKALPTIPDQDPPPPEPQRYRDARSPEPQRYRDDKVPSPPRYREDPGPPEFRRCPDEPAPPRRYSDDHPPSSQSHRTGRDPPKQNHNGDDKYNNRWNPRSENLGRKTYRSAGRTGSLDELEEFASCYKARGRGGERERTEEDDEDRGEYEMDFLEFRRYPSYRCGPPQHYYSDQTQPRDHQERAERAERPPRSRKQKTISPIASPQTRRGTWEKDRVVPPPPTISPPSSSSQEKDYDPTFLSSLLDRKSKLRGGGAERGSSRGRGEEDSDSPSKGSSKKSSGDSARHWSRSPGYRPEAESLPPYSDTERGRAVPTESRSSSQSSPMSVPGRREDPRDKARKANQNPLLSRDSLIV